MDQTSDREAPDAAPASLEELLLPLLESAYGTAYRLTHNSADAEDLVQEAALLACKGFASFLPGSNFKAWFFRIMTNCFYSRYRKRKREGTPVELEDTPDLYLYGQTAALGLHAATADPAGHLMDRLDAQAVARALSMLPEEYRVVATLYFMEDMAYQEIAATLEVPIGTVRSRLHRARRMMQRALWSVAEERGITASLHQQEA